jgi:hypothetical protein
MKTMNRRELLALSGFAIAMGFTSRSKADPQAVVCLAKQTDLTVESNESPFYLHYHQLSIPVAALLKQPDQGIVVKTSIVDQGSYDVTAFKKFIADSGLDPAKLSAHSHDVKISKAELNRIAAGQKDVEVRVISASGNYVHNFLITANPSTLAKVRRFQQGKLKI